jgi:hypothetical protein
VNESLWNTDDGRGVDNVFFTFLTQRNFNFRAKIRRTGRITAKKYQKLIEFMRVEFIRQCSQLRNISPAYPVLYPAQSLRPPKTADFI